MLIDEQFQYWISLDEKDYIKKIFNHPELTEEDSKNLEEIVNQCKMRQVYMSFATFSSSMLFYRLFMRKIPFFYNFFNKKHFKGLSIIKKTGCGFVFYWL